MVLIMERSIHDSVSFFGRHSIPEPGRTVRMSTQLWSEPLCMIFADSIRTVTESGFQDSLIQLYESTFSPIVPTPELIKMSSESKLKLAISALLCEWLIARFGKRDCKDLSLGEAEGWFLGDANGQIPSFLSSSIEWIPQDCFKELESFALAPDFVDLLPYVLEVFELVGANSPHFDREHRRAQQRVSGVVYTPSDVSDFIICETLAPWLSSNELEAELVCLDPACGTGLFLRSALLARHASGRADLYQMIQSLYGLDISHQAIQSCAFTLLASCLSLSHNLPISPWRMWQLIRGNLATADSTLLAPPQPNPLHRKELTNTRMHMRHNLLSCDIPVSKMPHLPKQAVAVCLGNDPVIRLDSTPISEVFPEVSEGFSAIFGNPPYSRLPPDSCQGFRAANFETAPQESGRPQALYPLFVEMMWKFGLPLMTRGGMVLPLSIAYSTSSQVKRLRAAMQKAAGDWRFSFFDRTPDSLFGDDVKTRNAIVLWHRDIMSKRSMFATSQLQRWSSRSRRELFDSIVYTTLGEYDISRLIPKLGSIKEREVYISLRKRRLCMAPLLNRANKSSLIAGTEYPHIVFLSSTAYNWIPIFRAVPVSRADSGQIGLPPSVHALVCPTSNDAAFVFACLNSRLTYWLWRIEGDGFHVTYDFIKRLPFNPSILPHDHYMSIIDLAARLWSEMQLYSVNSVNAGRTRTSYYPYSCQASLDSIDSFLLKSLEIPTEFLSFLEKFVAETIIAGRGKELETNSALRRLLIKEELDEQF